MGETVSLVRVFLVDDNDDFLDGVSECLAQRPDFLIVGRAHSGQETLVRLPEVGADLVLVDMTLPDMSGLEVTRRIKLAPPAPRVVLMTFHDSHAARLVATAAGADGLISEAGLRERLVPLIEKLFSGSTKQYMRGEETT